MPEYRDAVTDPRVGDTTIRHVLIMSSGIDEMRLSFEHLGPRNSPLSPLVCISGVDVGMAGS